VVVVVVVVAVVVVVVSIAWLDYKKAYDSVPHNWVDCCLQLFHFHPIISQCIHQLMSLWHTTVRDASILPAKNLEKIGQQKQ